MSHPKKQKKIAAERQRLKAPFNHRPAFNVEQALTTAITNHQAGNLQQAEKIYEEILSINPNHAGTLHAQAIMACQRGQHVAAVDFFQKAIKEDPAKPVYHFNLGNAFKDLGRFAEAVPCYGEALRLKPDYCEALNNLGTALQGQDKFAEAVASYQQALRIKPDYAEALYNLANSLRSLDRLPEAIVCLQQAIAAKENFPEVYNCLGNIFQEQGKPEAAIGCFQHALRLNPEVAEFHFNLATAFNGQGRFNEAIACYEKAVELAPGLAAAHNNLGNILKGKWRFPEAITSYNKALQVLPDYALAHGNLGDALAQIGDLNGAIAHCQRALALDPDIPEVYMLLGALLFMTREWQQFETLIDTTLANPTLSTPNKEWIMLQQALRAWMAGNLVQCTEYLQVASSIQYRQPQGKREVGRLAYYCLLKKLADYRTAFPQLYDNEEAISAFMIGDSHCLSYANLSLRLRDTAYTVAARLIIGCKSYHLAKDGHNFYKEAVRRNIADLPESSTVIMAFGEIDCRVNEGIYAAWEKKFQHRPIEEMVQEVVEGYASFIAAIQQEKKFKIILFGVPAPKRSKSAHLSTDALVTYLAVPKLFNEYLQKYAAQNGWCFLDAYALTCDEQGFANGTHHLDDHHLYPAALALLVSEHAISPHFSS